MQQLPIQKISARTHATNQRIKTVIVDQKQLR